VHGPFSSHGVIEAQQTKDGKTERNDRLLAVAANSATHRSIHTLSDLSQDLVAQIEHFFVSYNEMKGKRFEVRGQAGKKRGAHTGDGRHEETKRTIAFEEGRWRSTASRHRKT
jgi:inorganic pyrophosphatase